MADWYLDKIRSSKTGSGYDVYTFNKENRVRIYKNVNANIVRCAVGRDLDYLLTTQGESLGFPLDNSEIRDFKKYQDY